MVTGLSNRSTERMKAGHIEQNGLFGVQFAAAAPGRIRLRECLNEDRPVKIISMLRCVISILLVLCLFSGTAWGDKQSRGKAEAKPSVSAKPGQIVRSSGPISPVMRVDGWVGQPEVTEGPQTGAFMADDLALAPGTTVQTDADSRIAIVIGASLNASREISDVLLLGPSTKVQFVAIDKSSEDFRPDRPLSVVVHTGSYRLVVRSLTGETVYTLEAGGRIMHLDAADVIGTYDPDADNASYMLHSGEVTIEAGKRKLRLRSGMIRTIEGGKIRGAKQLPDGSWEQAVALTSVPDVDLTQPVITKSDPPENVPVQKKPAEPKPVEPKAPATPSLKATAEGPKQVEGDYVYVRMATSMGVIDLELDHGRAPVSVENFLSYVDKGYYEGTVFHRVISNFMIQGGGFTADMKQKETDQPIKNEWKNGLKNLRGTIAMARTSAPDSATSQFYINVMDNDALDQPRGGAAYAVFGKVINGMDVVDAIRKVRTGRKGRHADVPLDSVIIERVKRTNREAVNK